MARQASKEKLFFFCGIVQVLNHKILQQKQELCQRFLEKLEILKRLAL